MKTGTAVAIGAGVLTVTVAGGAFFVMSSNQKAAAQVQIAQANAAEAQARAKTAEANTRASTPSTPAKAPRPEGFGGILQDVRGFFQSIGGANGLNTIVGGVKGLFGL